MVMDNLDIEVDIPPRPLESEIPPKEIPVEENEEPQPSEIQPTEIRELGEGSDDYGEYESDEIPPVFIEDLEGGEQQQDGLDVAKVLDNLNKNGAMDRAIAQGVNYGGDVTYNIIDQSPRQGVNEEDVRDAGVADALIRTIVEAYPTVQLDKPIYALLAALTILMAGYATSPPKVIDADYELVPDEEHD